MSGITVAAGIEICADSGDARGVSRGSNDVWAGIGDGAAVISGSRTINPVASAIAAKSAASLFSCAVWRADAVGMSARPMICDSGDAGDEDTTVGAADTVPSGEEERDVADVPAPIAGPAKTASFAACIAAAEGEIVIAAPLPF